MRFLLDTNILIPLQDSFVVLKDNLKTFIRLAHNRHQLLYHPASRRDIARDSNVDRRNRTLSRLEMYDWLDEGPACTWKTSDTPPNDTCDNSILYARNRIAAHALI